MFGLRWLNRDLQLSRSLSTARPYDLHRLDSGPAAKVELTAEDASFLYKNMHLIRKMEDMVKKLYLSKKILGFCHVYTGQEACAVGMTSAMRPQDTVITTYRCHPWPVLMAEDKETILVQLFSELLAKKTGVSRGKGGSMHMYGRNFYGGQAIVGAQIPLGTGIALAHKYKGDGGVNLAIMGDAASNQGQVFESYNIAKLLSLPVIFVVENNLYGMGTHDYRGSANTDYYTTGGPVPGIRMDGMDILMIREAVKYAIEHIKSGKGPILLEMLTYRYYGHSMSDPGTTYRSREDVQEVRKTRDPIKTFLEKIYTNNLVTKEEITSIEKNNEDLIKKSLEAATKAPEQTLEELTCDVYASSNSVIRMPQFDTFRPHKNLALRKGDDKVMAESNKSMINEDKKITSQKG